jgi:hypothetical protein
MWVNPIFFASFLKWYGEHYGNKPWVLLVLLYDVFIGISNIKFTFYTFNHDPPL